MEEFDLVVIGGGPGGYVPAIRAAQMGKKVLVVEERELGGTCLNVGCIPTKALWASARLLQDVRQARKLGMQGSMEFSYSSLAKRKDKVTRRLRKGVEGHLEKLGVEVRKLHGELVAPDVVDVDGTRVKASRVLLSPGSRPALPGPFSVEGVPTSTEALAWTELPRSLTVVGGGVIGCEFAGIFAALDVKVTVVEMLPDVLPGVDPDVTRVVVKGLKRLGVEVLTESPAKSVEVNTDAAAVVLEQGDRIESDRLLVAVGRWPRVDDLGLKQAGVDHTSEGISIDEHCRTNLPGVYAAGDATGKWQLAHAASAQALAAVDHMFGSGRRTVDPDTMPACIFTHPEVAVVGPGEEECEDRGIPVRVGRARYMANGKAVGMGKTDGFLKLICREADDVAVGVQIVGADASSLVGEAVAVLGAGTTATELAGHPHPHPTLTEMFMEAAESLGEGAIHG
ncbi:dihydrolipoyl dehydrogenase [Candidatus Fermentibacteria bacterium]|nr:dihydrolipoyl dehydrogenase [Candidatus Fermentibacteria bacterium]